MKIGRICYPVTTLGPGDRVAVWVQGCSRHCFGCMSPELQSEAGIDVPVETIARSIADVIPPNTVLTISGGEPLEQSAELIQLLQELRPHFKDILLYTGYDHDEAKVLGNSIWDRLTTLCDVVVSGPYIDSQNNGCPLRGSGNQDIHFCSEDNELRQSYEKYMALGRPAPQVFFHENGVTIAGIPAKKGE